MNRDQLHRLLLDATALSSLVTSLEVVRVNADEASNGIRERSLRELGDALETELLIQLRGFAPWCRRRALRPEG